MRYPRRGMKEHEGKAKHGRLATERAGMDETHVGRALPAEVSSGCRVRTADQPRYWPAVRALQNLICLCIPSCAFVPRCE